jgi:bifunctional DNA-binding transcriptional regulator/antitoxin component of YhaV-PrlF toxin-antitoxin module
MRIGERGQVTIPLPIRNQLGFLPHVEVAFFIKGNGVLLARAKGETEQALNQIYGKKKICA